MKLAEIAADTADDRLELEVKGAVNTLAQWSGQTWSDYVVPWGAAVKLLGMSRSKPLVEVMVSCGLLEDISTDDERKYRLIDDEEGMFHIVTRDKKTMDAKRKADRSNGQLVVPVLLRDGAMCRYTGEVVNFDDRRTESGGTFDHREPDEPTTVNNFVVCSRGINEARGKFPDPDRHMPLMEPPESPVYSAWVMDKLRRWPVITARVCAEMGIDNPLHRTAKAPTPDLATSQATATSTDSTPRQDPTGTQPEGDPRSAAPQVPASSATDAPGSDTAATSLPASKAVPKSPQPSRAPTGDQPHGEPRPTRDASASDAPGGNGQRRRRRRRRR